MKRCLLDSSFLVDLFNEYADARIGPVTAWLRRNPRAELWISRSRSRKSWREWPYPRSFGNDSIAIGGKGSVPCRPSEQRFAKRRAARRMGENDVWQTAIAECMSAVVVGHDRRAFDRLGDGYEDHRAR